ncbi:putative nuclease of restriction endonuclease-like (RecB) superfamily [Flavobacterium croceum DSM 17960]|uniref:Putative nuclease of restriction endonuclease-like (RecB) superfamily n=1 Tax=Flavobacterium croceum DSM 17960 TaxID=1121886 RepID=A0A2S4N7Q7_9FLAO|nr:PDDEXK nuclease domain-containing protein [Flavobacterium croceum]POS01728.1 putative nuclease of restriction endonuclease-like (RecB) superfamily [Flavobacterium croceum DSM 17960]
MLYINEIKQILLQARQKTYQSINTAMIEAYWNIGRKIVEEEQNGKQRADYGKEIVKTISLELSKEFGKGFSARTIWEMRQFYIVFPDIKKMRTLFAQLNWSHFQRVLKVSDEEARMYYLKEAAQNTWSVRTLDRNISTLYYQRLLSSQNKEILHEKENSNEYNIQNFIKNPTVLEFLNLPSTLSYTEAEFEKALIDNLQKFILELGKGFAFVERQQHIKTETADFFIDLVFYNYILKCFVIIELKTHTITHQDIGQLDMYVRMYDDLKKQKEDNPTIGILLCTETDRTIVKYSVLNEKNQLFTSKYLAFLPSEKELEEEIERQKLLFSLK